MIIHMNRVRNEEVTGKATIEDSRPSFNYYAQNIED